MQTGGTSLDPSGVADLHRNVLEGPEARGCAKHQPPSAADVFSWLYCNQQMHRQQAVPS